jgi:hypothetical protein
LTEEQGHDYGRKEPGYARRTVQSVTQGISFHLPKEALEASGVKSFAEVSINNESGE